MRPCAHMTFSPSAFHQSVRLVVVVVAVALDVVALYSRRRPHRRGRHLRRRRRRRRRLTYSSVVKNRLSESAKRGD